MHYRNVDVSSIKELVRRWYPRVYYATPAKTGNHRALADITESISRAALLPRRPFSYPSQARLRHRARPAASLLTEPRIPTTDQLAMITQPSQSGRQWWV